MKSSEDKDLLFGKGTDLLDTLRDSLVLGSELLSLPANALEITKLTDRIEANSIPSRDWLFRLGRSNLLTRMLQRSREEYITTATFLGNRISRNELPNLQDVPLPDTPLPLISVEGLVADCTLPNATFGESPLDMVLLSIFRGLVREQIGWKSETQGITGLLEEGQYYMLSPNGTEENQHNFVKNTLAGLMTPILPPFYRIFMAGIVPSKERGDPQWLVDITNKIIEGLPESIQKHVYPGKQFGPWFYAPFLTSFITPTFLAFLVGPSRWNRRKDGELGGLVIEKCKFLQESGCKGLCLHQCKLPAQQFFDEKLGLDLNVQPNFATQECQWSWGEVAPPHTEDPAFPKGCLEGCPTRNLVADKTTTSVSCY